MTAPSKMCLLSHPAAASSKVRICFTPSVCSTRLSSSVIGATYRLMNTRSKTHLTDSKTLTMLNKPLLALACVECLRTRTPCANRPNSRPCKKKIRDLLSKSATANPLGSRTRPRKTHTSLPLP